MKYVLAIVVSVLGFNFRSLWVLMDYWIFQVAEMNFIENWTL